MTTFRAVAFIHYVLRFTFWLLEPSLHLVLHVAKALDAVLDTWVAGEQRRHAVLIKGIDEHEGIGVLDLTQILLGNAVQIGAYLLKGRRQVHWCAREHGAAAVGSILPIPRQGHDKQLAREVDQDSTDVYP